MDFGEQKYPLSAQQLLLRDSKLRNTDYVFGAVIFTGHDTKVIQNSTDPPSKRSKIEKKMDKVIYFLFCVLFLIAFLGSILFGFATKGDLDNGLMKRWYLRPDSSTIFFDPKRAAAAAIFHFLTALMLYNFFIPISLYFSIEMVKVLQSIFINQDIHMYYEETDKPALARTSNLNEELGQVDTILSDKTGTLTCNSMEFIKCSVAGVAYGRGVTEVEQAMGMKQIIIHLEIPEIQALEKAGDKMAIAKASRESVHHQISEAAQLLSASRGTCQTFALIIDGKSLTYALEDNMKNMFLELTSHCASVICCRSSPKQKALAVMSSDIAIAQFRYLERLLLVHGHWCYRRMSSMMWFFPMYHQMVQWIRYERKTNVPE
ncbi:hypothetical protein JHK85_016164 [Glycine max]|nr:hypothetical protein JHK85_016164 [Glycine max]